ncbi:MAG: GNAT family N-acetyltransferase [Candidatus Binatia bacterium]
MRHGAQNETTPASAISLAGRSNRRTEVRIARGLDDLLMVYTIRAAVYMAEQDCPFAEEFDGNDACATHLIGFVDGEPAGCLRIRFFADFCKVERLAVRKNYRRSYIVRSLIREGFNHCRRKGYTKFYAHAREGLEPFWAYFGAKPLPGTEKFVFSGHAYTEMVGEFEPSPDSISIKSGPMMILRPEGEWDRPGVLEFSSVRMARKPTENWVTESLSMAHRHEV